MAEELVMEGLISYCYTEDASAVLCVEAQGVHFEQFWRWKQILFVDVHFCWPPYVALVDAEAKAKQFGFITIEALELTAEIIFSGIIIHHHPTFAVVGTTRVGEGLHNAAGRSRVGGR